MTDRPTIFPFSAIVGQDLLKKALLLNVVDPNIGGVLIKGDRGTAKSTAVRAMAQLLPGRRVSEGCPFGCSSEAEMERCPVCSRRTEPHLVDRRIEVVELPISATEDKVVGTIDITAAIQDGEKRFEPGILAKANGNILYVDEVNLLNDHIVDVLLDVAAMGVNTVEREGISYSHPSRFVLVGTMNPEEGDLRPQLLDRFGLCVSVEGIRDVDSRMEIARRRRDFTRDPGSFMDAWRDRDSSITFRVVEARRILPEVVMGEDMMRLAVETCVRYNVDGHRADIAMMNTATAMAALDGRRAVTERDVEEAAVLVLAHRASDPPRYTPPEDGGDTSDPDDGGSPQDNRDGPSDDGRSEAPDQSDGPSKDSDGTVMFSPGREFKVRSDVLGADLRLDSIIRESSGRRMETESWTGRYVGSRIPDGRPSSIAVDATIRAAAVRSAGSGLSIGMEDVREKVRTRRTGNLVVFTVDASGSMGAEQRMTLVKAAVLSLLTDAYQKRDRVALVTFRGEGAEVIVPPTSDTGFAKRCMSDIPTGGRTPLVAGLSESLSVIRRETLKDRTVHPVMVIVSDGRANKGSGNVLESVCGEIRREDVDCVVLDSESGFVKLGLARKLADMLDARYMELEGIR